MTKQTSTFDQRVAELRQQGQRLMDAHRIAMAEQRAQAEQIADQTYRQS